jgi:hypothetical protein
VSESLKALQEQLRQLGRNIGTASSLIRRKLNVSHDERDQMVMLDKWSMQAHGLADDLTLFVLREQEGGEKEGDQEEQR